MSTAPTMARPPKGGGRPPEFETLKKALDSGDLEGAKSALEAIQTKHEEHKAKSTGANSDPMASMIENLSKALESGDVDAASEIFSKFEEEMKSKRPPGRQGPQSGVQNDLTAQFVGSRLSVVA